MNRQKLGLLAGPAFYFLIIFFFKPDGLTSAGVHVLAATVWMAIWWISEAVPIAVTALLPLVLFPMSDAMPVKSTAALYAHPIIFLFIGGFIIATAIQKWNLHQRIALNIISRSVQKPAFIILAFMIATGFLSMWISNTATTIMMVPIAMAVMQQIQTKESNQAYFGKALMLGIAYAASIGGIATLIGTPTNVIFSAMIEERYGWEISFAQWMLFAFPVAVVLLFFAWWYLAFVIFPFKNDENSTASNSQNQLRQMLNQLGPMRYEEKMVLLIFGGVAFCWMSRSLLIKPYFPAVTDTVIAIAGAILLFVVPVSKEYAAQHNKNNNRAVLLDWETAVKIPWGIILLFGGGLSLAFAFDETGLADWIGIQFAQLQVLPTFILLFLLVLMVNFLTEITSNVATVSMMLPVLAALSASLGLHPYLLMIAATCAASCAFMLPVATAPNAIVFASGNLKISDMIRAGLGLNVLSVVLLSFYLYFVMPYLFGIQIIQ